jgi:hypothetical protein
MKMLNHKSRFPPFFLLTILLTLSPKAFLFAEKNHVKFAHLSVDHGLFGQYGVRHCPGQPGISVVWDLWRAEQI